MGSETTHNPQSPDSLCRRVGTPNVRFSTKLFNGKCLTYKQINNTWFSGILPDSSYLLQACRKNEGKQQKKPVNSVVSCSTQGNPSASLQHPAHVAGAIEYLPTLFPLPAVEPALQNRQRVFR